MAIQIGKYKRPGIFIEEFDQSVITSPTVAGISNLVIGVSKKGPVNTPILLNNLADLERIFGPLDRNLERKGSYFHRTIQKMLEASPVFAINLLLTDDTLDLLEYQSLSAATSYQNDIEREAPYRRFFDNTGFWKRDTESFLNIVDDNVDFEKRVLNFTNLSDKFITVFCFKSQRTGFDRSMLEWYGSLEKVPPYVYPTDYASDYLVDVVVVAGDWSNYADLSVDAKWSTYFSASGLRKDQVRNFANDRNVTTLGYYDGLSLIPYFRDSNGTNIFVETVINRDTDRTGLFCAFDAELFETDYPKGLVDLIGNNLVGDSLVANPPTNDETYYSSLDGNDGTADGQIGIKFLSYDETITESVRFTNVVLDRPGNVVALFGTNSAVSQNILEHTYDDGSIAAKGGYLTGNIDSGERTYWFAEGYVNDLYRASAPSMASQSVTFAYTTNTTSDNGYAIISNTLVPISGTQTIAFSASYYPLNTSTQSYPFATVLDTNGVIKPVLTLSTASRPSVAATDIVLGFGTVSVLNGNFATSSGVLFTDFTVNNTTSGGPDAYIPLSKGVDYTISTASVATGAFKVEFLNTNQTAATNNYELYRKIKTFNSILSVINSSTSARSLMLLDPQTNTEKLSLADVTVSDIKTATSVNKSFVISTGLSASDVSSIVTNGELVFYKTDDEFLLGLSGLDTKNEIWTATYGVVSKYSTFYNSFDSGNISTSDVIYQNTIINDTDMFSDIQVTFLPGETATSSLAGYDYLLFRIPKVDTSNVALPHYSENNDYFLAVTTGYQFLINGASNSGVFETKNDEGLSPGSTTPDGAGVNGRAYRLGYIDTASYSYYAYEVVQNVVDEELDITNLYAYSNDFDDAPVYLKMYQDTNGLLTVRFTDFDLTTARELDTLAASGLPLLANSTFYVNSLDSNYRQTLEVEYPTGWTPVANKVLVKSSRYPEVKVNDFLEASYDESLLESDQMPKKLTRITSKRTWSGSSDYLEITCDAPIKLQDFGGDKQTFRYASIDNYVSTYKAISLKGFRIRQESLPDGTETRQSEILDLVAKGTNLFEAIVNKDSFDFRYLIDSFGLGLIERSKQQLVDICGTRLDCLGILNMPSMRQFKNSTSPTFVDTEGVLQTSFIAQGGDPESNPAFLYSFGDGNGASSVGYFLPYVTVNDNGRPVDVPPAAYVGLAYMRKQTSNVTTITPWTIVAGVTNGRITNIAGLEQDFNLTDIENLNQAQMNPIVFKRNRGYVIETENTGQTLFKSSLSYIHSREVLVELERELSDMLLDFQWKFNTQETRAEIKLRADVICEKYVARNGLFNYFNKIDEENNTPEIIDNQIGVLDTYVEIIKGMGIIVNNITILRTGAIQSGGFIIS